MTKKLRNLLIISCSKTKDPNPDLLPASERYAGITYKIIHKLMREERFPAETDILIVSAEHGLIDWDTPIANYDRVMTAERAEELAQDIFSKMRDFWNRSRDHSHYFNICVNLGKYYRAAITNPLDIRCHELIYTTGGIGQKNAQMRNWLLELHKED